MVIIKVLEVNFCLVLGDYEGVVKVFKEVKKFCWWFFGVGIIFIVIYFVLVVIVVVFG